MKKFECGTVVEGCDGVVTGETEDDVMRAAGEHAASVHGMDELPDDVAARVRAGITEA